MARKPKPTGKDLHKKVAEKANIVMHETMRGGPDGTFRAGPMVSNWVRDVVQLKKPGTSLREETKNKLAAEYRRDALKSMASDNRQASKMAYAKKYAKGR